MTIREAIAERISTGDYVSQVARKAHEQNYERLDCHRDGTLSWQEDVTADTRTIDDQAVEFAAIPTLAIVGTGSQGCECDWCNTCEGCSHVRGDLLPGFARDDNSGLVVNIETGKPCANCAGYCSTEPNDIDFESDELTQMQDEMLAELDAIHAGYFDDEPDDEIVTCE